MKERVFNVFVFGSLKQGGHFDQSKDALEVQPAKCHGFTLWISRFPFMLQGDIHDAVIGELHRYKHNKLATLDHIEGHPHLYERREVYVETPFGAETAYAYFLIDEDWLKEGKRVPDDNFDAVKDKEARYAK